ncbi:hypothetical protein B1748_23670 [Paenibacillus sp. MY03]|uniref:hypothetical protein n=1 Tax=Paenibacillus sp. MY03 TaxID=302980 RepID=UPI000B3BFA05|nr:hypothetical protein [Paenibacillus sp. MY03]OUS73009.1 hypothetical protein B1748_23670 [Paenibacillus sp. MY03]
MRFAIASKANGWEEYMCEQQGLDCFSDDLGSALLFYNWRNIPFHVLEPTDYIVKVEEDEEGGLLVVGTLSKEEMDENSF